MSDSDPEWEEAVVLSRHDILDYNEDNLLPESPEVIKAIQTWLQPTDFEGEGSEFQKHVSSHLPGTGEWFLGEEAWREWHDSDAFGMLWVRGKYYSTNCIMSLSD